MHVEPRYVERRVDRSGAERWCSHRRGHKLARLPDNPVKRIGLAKRLNTAVDGLAPAEFARRSIGWVTQRYDDCDEFWDLSRGTVRCYRRFLREIEALGPDLPFASFTSRAVVEFIETYSRAHQRRHSAADLERLFKLDRYHGVVAKDVSGWLGRNTLARQFGYAKKRWARCLIFPLFRDGCEAEFPDAEIEVRRTPNKTLSND